MGGSQKRPRRASSTLFFNFGQIRVVDVFWVASATPKDPHKSAHHEHQRVGSRVSDAAESLENTETAVNTVVFGILPCSKENEARKTNQAPQDQTRQTEEAPLQRTPALFHRWIAQSSGTLKQDDISSDADKSTQLLLQTTATLEEQAAAKTQEAAV